MAIISGIIVVSASRNNIEVWVTWRHHDGVFSTDQDYAVYFNNLRFDARLFELGTAFEDINVPNVNAVESATEDILGALMNRLGIFDDEEEEEEEEEEGFRW